MNKKPPVIFVVENIYLHKIISLQFLFFFPTLNHLYRATFLYNTSCKGFIEFLRFFNIF